MKRKPLLWAGAMPHAPPFPQMLWLIATPIGNHSMYNKKKRMSSREFRKINNSHLQRLFNINKDQANRLLNKIRKKYGKKAGDAVRLVELCEHEKLDIEKVCAFFGWKD